MWKPVRLQGVGASAVTINADAHPAGKMDQWRRQVNCAFGLNLDGTVVTASDDWNSSFYGKKVLPPDILVRGDVHNKAADKLLAQVAAAANKK